MTTSAANGSNAYNSQVVQDQDEQGGRARRRQARTSKDGVVQGGEERVHDGRASIVTVGVVTILISAWGAVIPFVEPIFGFHATGTPSFHWNAAHALLAVVPGVIGVGYGLCGVVGGEPGCGWSKPGGPCVGWADHNPQRSVVHHRAEGSASDHHTWGVLRPGSPRSEACCI